MRLSIIIPAFNEEVALPVTLEKIRFALEENASLDFQWEIIVCDNNSTDRTEKVARQAGAKVVFESENHISKARNAGAAIAGGEWLLFIDADSHPSPGLIGEVLAVIEDGRFVGCGTTVEIVDGPLWNKLRMERLNPLMRLLKWSGGAFLLCEAEAFRQIGGFSPYLYALEEIDFIIRLRRYGRRSKRQFTVLHRYPLQTSGRKGELRVGALFKVFFSNTMAIFFLVLHLILPRGLKIKGSRKLLGFWYNQRNKEE